MVVAGHVRLAQGISSDVGMEFRAETGKDADGERWIRLTPAAASDGHVFDVKVQMTWRRLRLSFEAQKFAGEMIRAMGRADDTGRATFRAVMEQCVARGATVLHRVNGNTVQLHDERVWGKRWRRMDLRMSKRLPQLDGAATPRELNLVRHWTRRFIAAVLAIAPLEELGTIAGEVGEGFEEGAVTVNQTVRYERDRRNRAAAIAIHGTACLACGFDFGARYGKVAEGFIEVHHTVPLASLRGKYIVNPVKDLVPLCPNCHAVAHRRNPPLTVADIKAYLGDPEVENP